MLITVTNGTDGTNCLQGTNDPTNSTGNNGDTYINITTGIVWNKLEGTWIETNLCLKGTQGRGITNCTKSTQGTTDTYTLTFSDNTTYTFTVKNGIDGKRGPQIKLLSGDKAPEDTTGFIINDLGIWGATLYEVQGTENSKSWESVGTLKGDKGDPARPIRIVQADTESKAAILNGLTCTINLNNTTPSQLFPQGYTVNGVSYNRVGIGDIIIVTCTTSNKYLNMFICTNIVGDDITFQAISAASAQSLKRLKITEEIVDSGTKSLNPNVYYKFTSTSGIQGLTITLIPPEDSSIINEYMFEFPCVFEGTVITLPTNIKWVNDFDPLQDFIPGYLYQVSIQEDIGIVTYVPLEV